MLCDTFPGEVQQKYLLTPEGESVTDKSSNTTEVQLGESVSLLELLTETRTAKRHPDHQKFIPGWVMTHESLDPEL